LDIETIDDRRNLAGIGTLAFHPKEREWIQSQVAAERAIAFYHIWTQKEALYKLQCATKNQTSADIFWQKNSMSAEAASAYHCFHYHEPRMNLFITLCSEKMHHKSVQKRPGS
jgi:phosphopantetheinyl transferase